ncbi:MAG TPA: bifunctional homocysteine S-methyltransferase/methylenetetrahydrofolate reductase, partial [Thermomicrobiales bacterium]|nr:bifunctional homocysteine S-methyltransferase/methylenetetrahydrofolate reductase [Thermomicrobiales bacterium]
MAHPLLDRLAAGVVLGDGAMGTMLYEAGHAFDECLDALNLTHPATVAQVHRSYLNAGADVIETNTFGANRFRLESHGLVDKVRDINFRGVKIAREEREISGRPVLVAGSIGPTGRTLEPYGTLPREAAVEAFREQIGALLEAGVDLLVIETMGDLTEMDAAIEAAREASDLPIVALMTFGEDGRTMSGAGPAEVVTALVDRNVDVIGANCSVGPQRLLSVVRQMHGAVAGLNGNRPYIAALPNAGWPTKVGSRLIYRSTPEYFAQFARDAVDAGASLVGGCCGTTPSHIVAMRTAVDAHAPAEGAQAATAVATVTKAAASSRVLIVDVEEETEVKKKLGKTFLKCVEIDPPKGLNPQKAIDGAKMLKEVGVDAINVADSPMARVRMSAMTLCYLIQHEVGIETIIHFTTRDRSLMGLQSELLGAHAAGIRNILALTGDPPSLGDYPDSTPVYDVDSIGLIRVISKMKEGEDSAGASIGRTANFTIACAVDPTKPDLEDEARRLRAKIDAGADFVMTQPIFDLDVWTNFLEVYGVDRLPIPVMIGILPLQSSRHAEFLHHEVPGITIPDSTRAALHEAGERGAEVGLRIAEELLDAVGGRVAGTYIMPSFGRYEQAAELVRRLRAR